MKIAFASRDGIHINDHFGWCQTFYLYEITENSFVFLKRVDASKKHQEEGEKLSYKINCLEDSKILCAFQIGPNASTMVKNSGIFVIKATTEEDTIMALLWNLMKLKNTNPPLWMQRLLNH